MYPRSANWILHCAVRAWMLGTTAILTVDSACAQTPNAASGAISITWPDEALSYGILAAGGAQDTLHTMVKLVAVPGDTLTVDSLPAGTFAKYLRLDQAQLSVDGLSPERPWVRLDLPGGPKWVDEEHLMVFSGYGDNGHVDPKHCFRYFGDRLVVLYSSRFVESSYSSALALWTKSPEGKGWVLSDLVLNAIGTGLYMLPWIDSTSEESETTRIYLKSIGVDGDDMWGEKITYEIHDHRLIAVKREHVEEHRTDE